jgi:uncharacterized membrane protein
MTTKKEKVVSKSRLEALSDGLFAIVLTLLVFDLIPCIADVETEVELRAAFVAVWPQFVSFAISFIVISIIWVAHHTYFQAVTRVDEVQLWLNLLVLFCLSLIPFSASLLGEHHNLSTAGMIYGLNVAACVCAMMLNWWYATGQNLVHSNVDSRSIRQMKIRTGFILISSLIGVAVAWFNPVAAFYLYVFNAFVGLLLQIHLKPLQNASK